MEQAGRLAATPDAQLEPPHGDSCSPVHTWVTARARADVCVSAGSHVARMLAGNRVATCRGCRRNPPLDRTVRATAQPEQVVAADPWCAGRQSPSELVGSGAAEEAWAAAGIGVQRGAAECGHPGPHRRGEDDDDGADDLLHRARERDGER